uniref:Uncharacterized protein n=1 Tax=Marseillevirus LCMAC102 TaxID=2506603 RepID=A0A481YUT4_9VIRU|nr:MAG: hypothetical protein LCMAC102_03400 [Marseillevirus LCMAC102]
MFLTAEALKKSVPIAPTCKKCGQAVRSVLDHFYVCDSWKDTQKSLKNGSCEDVYPDYCLKVTYDLTGNNTLTKVYDLHKEFKNRHLLYNNKINMRDMDANDLLTRYYADDYSIIRAIVIKKISLVVLSDE